MQIDYAGRRWCPRGFAAFECCLGPEYSMRRWPLWRRRSPEASGGLAAVGDATAVEYLGEARKYGIPR
jgi:hypothetical protein